MKKIRWNCPECGKGKNLSSRPRKNATDRFCIPCSIEKGTLVERFAPKLEKNRQAKKAKKQAQAARATRSRKSLKEKAKERDAQRFIVQTDQGPFDALAEFNRIWKIALELHPPLAEQFKFSDPEFTLSKSKDGFWSSGRAYYHDQRVHITAGSSQADLISTIVHEIAHHMRFANGDMIKGRRWQHHDDQFSSLEKMLAEESKIILRKGGHY